MKKLALVIALIVIAVSSVFAQKTDPKIVTNHRTGKEMLIAATPSKLYTTYSNGVAYHTEDGTYYIISYNGNNEVWYQKAGNHIGKTLLGYLPGNSMSRFKVSDIVPVKSTQQNYYAAK